MGSGSFDSRAYATFSASTAKLKTDEIFRSRTADSKLNPYGITVRESRDSADSPEATPIIVALDVTGSMGMLADVIVRDGLGVLFNSILDRKPITNPHIMFGGIGDAACDKFPLQVSQFEADNRLVEQLTQLYLEKGGGGNDHESYDLPWYFAANHTVHDSMEKRGKRGYLFTVGDEMPPVGLSKANINRVLGTTVERDVTAAESLAAAQRVYDVFHIIVAEGSFARHRLAKVTEAWQELMGQRVIVLNDHKKLAETVVSAIEVAEGRSAEDSAKGWGKDADVVYAATKHLPRGTTSPRLLGA